MYDSGKAAAAERHYSTAMRAAASAGDPVVGANTLAFWAIQHYSTGNPRGAVDLIEAALSQAPRTGSARLTSMLHARACRANAHAGDSRAADRSANAALDAYENAGPIEDDLPCVYWYNLGETYQLLGSSALNLGNPKQAVAHFLEASTATSQEAYQAAAFPRGHSIYLARPPKPTSAWATSTPPWLPHTTPSTGWEASPPHAAPTHSKTSARNSPGAAESPPSLTSWTTPIPSEYPAPPAAQAVAVPLRAGGETSVRGSWRARTRRARFWMSPPSA
ncbi:hypothetical protein POF50_008770 [Streptomyces sp. SL13]|uniref:Tetratricopeptide repeat protein n=1 Tax=Streptantibioticus silvisoli TaxID=2705255 RepID=A0AA90K8G9_9ACTN|nr:hypothetical protein [Streptantibioticus silvisoli]MDI5969432.1 hypothetical protein [Streptantibioticus silvisoli]